MSKGQAKHFIEKKYLLINWLSSIIRKIAGTCLFGIMLLTCIDVVSRYLGKPVYGSYDIISVSEGIIISFSLAYTQALKGHISITLFYDLFSKKSRELIDVGIYFISFCFFLLVTYAVVKDAGQLLRKGLVSMSIGLPLYPFEYAISLGCFVMSLQILLDLIQSLRRMFQK